MSHTTEQAIILLNARLSLCVHDLRDEMEALGARVREIIHYAAEPDAKIPSEPGLAAGAQRVEHLMYEARMLREVLDEIERASR